VTLISLATAIPYNAAKFQKSSVLLEEEELRLLLSMLNKEVGKIYLYRIGAVIEEGQLLVSMENFLDQYRDYLNALKNNGELQQSFSLALTVDPKTLYAIDVGDGRKIAKLHSPSIHITSTAICYLPELHTFKEKVYGHDLIPWGLQFSYPQLFQDPESQAISNPLQEGANALLFKQQQRWIREHTKPTFFFTEQGEVRTAIRLGKHCFSWIHTHPKLQEAGIRVDHKQS
jgi:hypothetical protein